MRAVLLVVVLAIVGALIGTSSPTIAQDAALPPSCERGMKAGSLTALSDEVVDISNFEGRLSSASARQDLDFHGSLMLVLPAGCYLVRYSDFRREEAIADAQEDGTTYVAFPLSVACRIPSSEATPTITDCAESDVQILRREPDVLDRSFIALVQLDREGAYYEFEVEGAALLYVWSIPASS